MEQLDLTRPRHTQVRRLTVTPLSLEPATVELVLSDNQALSLMTLATWLEEAGTLKMRIGAPLGHVFPPPTADAENEQPADGVGG